MINEGGEVNPYAPLFFISYALPKRPQVRGVPPQRGISRDVLRFFEDLSSDVSELLGRDPGAYPGFIDKSMRAGQDWHLDIVEAAGTCQVFIPLISPSLPASVWCGKEWEAFACRKGEPRGRVISAHRASILPVVWVPFEMRKMPKVVRDIQVFRPDGFPDLEIADAYLGQGVLGLLRMGLEQKYRAFVWQLAREAVAVSSSYHIEPSTPDFSQLKNAFAEEKAFAEEVEDG